ncbi:MAG TPA: ATP-binding protein [Xanthobacteraceae bacterium]|nr:ATP-binding protein [Xanthobacteraceae bacterium]
MPTPRAAATRMLKVMMAASLLLPIALFSYAAWVAHENIRKNTDERIERELGILHEQTRNIFQSAAFALNVVDQITEDMSADAIRASERSLHEKLKRIDNTNRFIESLWILDEKGNALVTGSAYPLPAGSNYSDRDYFYANQEQDRGVYIGEVFKPRVRIAEPVFSVSRRLHPEKGGFRGVIEASISPAIFQTFFTQLSPPADGYYALVREDGSFLARYPSLEGRLGGSTRIAEAARTNSQSGMFTVVSVLDGIERKIGYRKIEDYPVYAMAGIKTSALFSEWVSTMAAHLIFGIPATALLFAVTGLTLQRTRRLYRETERRAQAEEALRHSQKMEAIGQLTGGVAHDFNNLLTIIIGNLDLAQRALSKGGADTMTRLETFVKNAMQGARRAASLTQRLLAFSRRQPLEPRPVRPDKLVQGMADMLRQSLGETYEIEIVGAAGLWQVEVDPVQLESAILNLAVNARDAMPGGGKLTVETSNTFLDENYAREHSEVTAGQYVQISVTDTGKGMSAETLDKAFEPFFTTKAAGEGTGLGLSQVYGYAKQSGGHVKIYSEPGEGTTVKIYLPRLTDGELPAHEIVRENPGDGQGEIILVVEDDEDVRGYVVDILREMNYRVFDAPDAASAVKIAEREEGKIDLLLTDVVLPGNNGRQLAEELQSRYAHIKALFMTGYSRNAIVHQGRLDRGVALIQKPLTQVSLAAKIREVLDNEKARQDAGPKKARLT